MKKLAVALFRKERVFLQSYSQATTGVWIAWGPVYVVDAGDVNSNQFIDELSRTIRVTLDNPVHGVPHPSQTEWKMDRLTARFLGLIIKVTLRVMPRMIAMA